MHAMGKTYTEKFELEENYCEDLIHIRIHNVNTEIRLTFECFYTSYKTQIQIVFPFFQ